MTSRPLLEAWGILVALGMATTLLTLGEPGGRAGRMLVAASVLALAGLKARLILGRYLGLAASPFWRRAFDLAGALFLTVCFVIYLMGAP